jgi:hypothetical protein
MPAEALIAGSVDDVAEEFRTFARIGRTDILVRHPSNNRRSWPSGDHPVMLNDCDGDVPRCDTDRTAGRAGLQAGNSRRED